MKLLHLDTSILGENSVSRALSQAAVARLRNTSPDLEVVYRDLVAEPIGHLTGQHLAGQSDEVQHDQAVQEDLTLGGTVLAEFLDADIIVLGVALYNFTVPSQLKAWIDRILVVGKTFRYTDTGPKGLAGSKRVIVTLARGGLYGAGTPMASFEHAETYLRSVLAFIGVTDPEMIVAEGIAIGPEQRAEATSQALRATECQTACKTDP